MDTGWRGLAAFILVAFAPAYILDYAIALDLLAKTQTAEAVTLRVELGLMAALLARMWLPAVASLAALHVERVVGLRRKLQTLGLREPRTLWVVLAALLPLAGFTLSIPLSTLLGCKVGVCGPLSLTPLPFIVIMLVLGVAAGLTVNAAAALGEELGWRGYLYNLLRPRLNTPSLVLVIGVLWGLWHAPLVYWGYNYTITPLSSCGPPARGWIALAVFTLSTVGLTSTLIPPREHSKSVIVPAMAHGTVNGVAGLYASLVVGSRLVAPPAGVAVGVSMLLVGSLFGWWASRGRGG